MNFINQLLKNLIKVYSQFKDNIWGVDLVDMQSLSRKNKGIKYLLRPIDLYSKYAFVILLKDKKAISIMLRHFNFEPSLKLRWCRARDLFGSQIPATTGGFEGLRYFHFKPSLKLPEFATLRQE